MKCEYNNLTFIPFRNSKSSRLENLLCRNNQLMVLPMTQKLTIYCENNPVTTYIKEFCNDDLDLYYNINTIFANKIGTWFLECKYNPKFKYCRDRVNKEYDNLLEND